MISFEPHLTQRLVPEHRSGAWIGSLRRVFGPVADVVDDTATIDTRPPHYLIALWKPLKPGQPMLPRWPRKALLVAPDANACVAELLRDIPPQDKLWLTNRDLDWGLVAEIVMLSESQLAPFQRRGLEEFVRDERQATLTSIRGYYRPSQDGGVQHRPTLPGSLT